MVSIPYPYSLLDNVPLMLSDAQYCDPSEHGESTPIHMRSFTEWFKAIPFQHVTRIYMNDNTFIG